MSTDKRPFHQTVVSAINRVSSTELECLAWLIKATDIPAGHDDIIAAWDKRRRDMLWGAEDLGVTAYLLEQKRTAEEIAQEKNDLSANKGRLMMAVVERLIDRYHRNHPSELDTKMFKLFEIAKRIYRAKAPEDFKAASEDLAAL